MIPSFFLGKGHKVEVDKFNNIYYAPCMEEYEEAKVRIIIGPSFEGFYHSQRDK